MSRYSNSGTRENHSKLSIYSKISIQEILQDPKMSYCLHPSKHSFCGDGIIQEGEVILKLFFFFMIFFVKLIFAFRIVIVDQWKIVFLKNHVVFSQEEVQKTKINVHGIQSKSSRNIASPKTSF